MTISMHRTHPTDSDVGILGTGSCLPATRISNRQVAVSINEAEEWIEERIGILERRFAAEDESGLDFAIGAAREALAAARVAPLDVDAIILATSTPDLPIPGIGTRLQGAIGAANAMAFDVNAACAGFLVSCEIGRGILAVHPEMDTVLVVASDTYSRVLDPSDRRTYPLFGDGAGAVVLSRVPDGEGFFSVEICTDGKAAHYVTGGPGLPVPTAGTGEGAHWLKMSGRDVADLVRSEFPRLVGDAVKERGITIEDIDHLICHQANPNLIKDCAARMGFAPEQVIVTGDVLGNTAAASIPVGLDIAVRDGRVRPGDTILMITFGAGMTWGRALLQWSAAGVPALVRGGTR